MDRQRSRKAGSRCVGRLVVHRIRRFLFLWDVKASRAVRRAFVAWVES